MRGLLEMRAQARAGSASGRRGSGPSLATTSSRRAPVTRAHWVAPRRSAYDGWSGKRAPPTSRSRTCPTGGGASSASRWTSKPPISPRWMWTTRSASKSRKRCLPGGLGREQGRAVELGGLGAEPALRAAHAQRMTGEGVGECRGEPVEGVALRHGSPVPPRRRAAAGARRSARSRRASRCGAACRSSAGERRLEEQPDEAGHLVEGVHPAADGDHVGVVVLAGQDAPSRRSTRGRPACP